jgi:hypothetical protein
MDLSSTEPVIMIIILYSTLCIVSVFLSDRNIGLENIMVYGPLYYICALCFNFVINNQYIRIYNKDCEMSLFTLILNTTSITSIILAVFMGMVFVMKWYDYFKDLFDEENYMMKSVTIWYFFIAVITSLISLNVSLSQQCVTKYDDEE